MLSSGIVKKAVIGKESFTVAHTCCTLPHKPRDYKRSSSSILLDNVKVAYNVFTGSMCELFYIPSEFHVHDP